MEVSFLVILKRILLEYFRFIFDELFLRLFLHLSYVTVKSFNPNPLVEQRVGINQIKLELNVYLSIENTKMSIPTTIVPC